MSAKSLYEQGYDEKVSYNHGRHSNFERGVQDAISLSLSLLALEIAPLCDTTIWCIFVDLSLK